MIKVERGIPIPKQRRVPLKYPFDDMAIGDSFFLPGAVIAKMGTIQSCARNAGAKVAGRTVTEGGVRGIRVWRTA